MRWLVLTLVLGLLAPASALAGAPTVSSIALDGPAGRIAFAAGAVFVAGASPAEVVDARRGRSVGTVDGSVGGVPGALAVGGGVVYLASGTTMVSRIDPVTRSVTATRDHGDDLAEFAILLGLAASRDAVWAIQGGQKTTYVLRLDPRTLELERRLPVAPYAGGHGLPSIALGADSVWVAANGAGVVRLDARTGKVRARIAVPDAVGVTVGLGAVWVTDLDGDALYRIDPRTNRKGKAIPVGDCPSAVAVGLGSVWVANACDGTVSRVDPARLKVDGAPLAVDDSPDSLAIGAGAVWVGYDGGTTLGRIVP